VVRFIDEHWARGHALVTCRALLDWQHREADGSYSFIVARRAGDRAVLGILGYIPTRRFDPGLADRNVIWLTTWKARDDAGVAGLGLALLQHLRAVEPHVAIGAIGLNPATTPIYRALGYRVGELDHFVRPNARVERFELASFANRAGDAAAAPDPAGAILLSRDDFFERVAGLDRSTRGDAIPHKTPAYFHRRYLCHPVYTYLVAGLLDGGSVAGLLAMRVAEHAGRRALRLVDMLGSSERLERSGGVVQSLLEAHDAEYADIYSAGIDPGTLERGGFTHIAPDGPDIVPDHFEPFERRNVRLHFAIKTGGAAVLFKGDADQDRPALARPVPA